MKLSARDTNAFLAAPQKFGVAALIYGEDRGQVQQKLEQVMKAVLTDPNDPFNRVDISAEQLSEDPAILNDEAAAMSLTGDTRLIVLREAKDGMAKLIEEAISALEAANGQAFLLVGADGLQARGGLRKLFEAHKACAAMACYKEEGANLGRTIQAALREQGLDADREAMQYLTEHLQGDRQRVMSEVEKIALYCMGQSSISLDDVMAVVEQNHSRELDALCNAVAGGAVGRASQLYTQLLREGESAVAVIRIMLNYLMRLYKIHAAMQDGASLDGAIKGLRPPVFFKQKDALMHQARLWNANALGDAMKRLHEAELKFKTGHPLPNIEVERALLFIATKAARAAQSRRAA